MFNLWKWMRGTRVVPNAMDKPALRWRSAMEDMLMTERKDIRRRRALARFRVMTYPEWCVERGIERDETHLIQHEIAYAEYCARKDSERRALTR